MIFAYDPYGLKLLGLLGMCTGIIYSIRTIQEVKE